MSRLEEIVEYEHTTPKGRHYVRFKSKEVYERIIQRAELYEATNKQLSPKLAKLNEFIQDRHFGDWGHSTVEIVMDLVLVLENQNKRYKQALESILSYDQHEKTVPKDVIDMIKKELAGESQ